MTQQLFSMSINNQIRLYETYYSSSFPNSITVEFGGKKYEVSFEEEESTELTEQIKEAVKKRFEEENEEQKETQATTPSNVADTPMDKFVKGMKEIPAKSEQAIVQIAKLMIGSNFHKNDSDLDLLVESFEDQDSGNEGVKRTEEEGNGYTFVEDDEDDSDYDFLYDETESKERQEQTTSVTAHREIRKLASSLDSKGFEVFKLFVELVRGNEKANDLLQKLENDLNASDDQDLELEEQAGG